ncbi:hypothetical protein DL98DRAFT_164199 [Cadophora sp. DSE1049]|nr:hypothetical protein DL98DRAFT_164199 [Cadophora sp. DSE1049]
MRTAHYIFRHPVSTAPHMMAWPNPCCIVFVEGMMSLHLFSSMTIVTFFSKPVDLRGDFSTFLRLTPLKKIATQTFEAILRYSTHVIPTTNSRASACQDQAHPFSQNHPPGTLLPRDFSLYHPSRALLPRERAAKVHTRANPLNRNGTLVLTASKRSIIRRMYNDTLHPSTRTRWEDFSLSIVIAQHANTACSDVAKAVPTAGPGETTSGDIWKLICQRTSREKRRWNESNWSTGSSTRRILI